MVSGNLPTPGHGVPWRPSLVAANTARRSRSPPRHRCLPVSAALGDGPRKPGRRGNQHPRPDEIRVVAPCPRHPLAPVAFRRRQGDPFAIPLPDRRGIVRPTRPTTPPAPRRRPRCHRVAGGCRRAGGRSRPVAPRLEPETLQPHPRPRPGYRRQTPPPPRQTRRSRPRGRRRGRVEIRRRDRPLHPVRRWAGRRTLPLAAGWPPGKARDDGHPPRRRAAGAWTELAGFLCLDDLFELHESLDGIRVHRLARARRACDERADHRDLGAALSLAHGWEDLSAFSRADARELAPA